MAQGSRLEFYDADEFPSYVEAKKAAKVHGVFLDYANDDSMSQTAVWDAIEIIQTTLTAVGKQDAKLRYVLTRDNVILDC